MPQIQPTRDVLWPVRPQCIVPCAPGLLRAGKYAIFSHTKTAPMSSRLYHVSLACRDSIPRIASRSARFCAAACGRKHERANGCCEPRIFHKAAAWRPWRVGPRMNQVAERTVCRGSPRDVRNVYPTDSGDRFAACLSSNAVPSLLARLHERVR